jgi:ribonuclease E
MDDTNIETGGAAAERPDTALQEIPADDRPATGDADNPSLTGDGGEAQRRRRRGSRGGQRRRKGTGPGASGESGDGDDFDALDGDEDTTVAAPVRTEASRDVSKSEGAGADVDARPDELPEPMREGRAMSVEAADKALVRKPQIGDTRPAPATAERGDAGGPPTGAGTSNRSASRRRKRPAREVVAQPERRPQEQQQKKRRRGARTKQETFELDPDLIENRRGRERNGKPIGRFFMCVQVRPGMTQVGVLEGRNLIEHYVSRPADDVSLIHGNIYVGRVQNVLPGMEAAFVDIATPKNAVLYRGDVQYDAEDIEEKADDARIEDILRARQLIICQVTKNPIGAKGARLTQEVSLPGRFVVLIPNSKTYGISKRLPDDVRKRLRAILDRVKPAEHGLIVRTAAEHATEDELRADMKILLDQWEGIAAKAAKTQRPTLLYREPELAVRVIREEFNSEYRGVAIDDRRLFEDVRTYVSAFNPELADRIEYYDSDGEGLPLFERFHVHEQVHRALDRKVWLPSGGSLIIEHTEALTVIDVNTGKNVGKSNLEATVFHNNMEAADEIAKQLRLRDIGGIIVIDFIDMEIRENRAKVVGAFRSALARDKTRTQVFDISDLGLVEMTRKRIGEGLLTEFSEICPECEGRGVRVDHSLLD